MDSNNFLQIKYDAFPDGHGGLEDFRDIEIFKKEIEDNYNSFIKGEGTGRGGSAYELIIHFISNLHLSDLSALIAIYLAKKVVTKAENLFLEKVLFKPLKNAYIKLKEKNNILDCFSFQIELQDITIFIYRTSENSLMSNLEKILKEVTVNLEQVQKVGNSQANEIHIPVLIDSLKDRNIYRIPLGMSETKSPDESDYFRYWGVKYMHRGLRTIYDCKNRAFLEDSSLSFPQFYLEDEFMSKKFN